MPLFDSLYNFARWLTGDETGAEDLVQEACTKDLRGFSSLTPGPDFRAWIFHPAQHRPTGDSDRNCHVENGACAQVVGGILRRGTAQIVCFGQKSD